jgi:hypothetical protein
MRRLKFLILFALSSALLAFSAWRFPVPLRGAGPVARALLADGVLLLAALAWGRSWLLRWRLFHASLSEEALFSVALGLIALSLLGSVLGALGGLYGWVLWLLLGLLFLTQWEHLEYFWQTLQRNLKTTHPWDGSTTEVLTLVAGVLGLLALAGLCLAPVTFYDALNYHLASMQRAIQVGRDLPQADNLFTWFPNIALPLWEWTALLSGNPFNSTLAPAFLNGILALILGLTLVETSSRWLSERKIWLAPALAWTQPLLLLSFGCFSPDPWMAWLAFLSLFAFLNAQEELDLGRQGAWLAVSTLLAGAACAAKPVAALHVAALLLLFAGQAWKRPAWRRWNWLLPALALLVLPLLPWFLRGLFLRSNPIYPFGLSLGGHELLAGGPSAYFKHIESFGAAWWQLPWSSFFEPMRLGGGGHLSWTLLALLPAAFAWRYSPAQRSLALYVGFSAILWCGGPHVLRYGLFAVPAACLLAAHGVLEVEAWAASKGWTYAWRVLVLLGLFLGAGQTLLIATKDFQPWNVALGLQDPMDYLAERGIPQAETAAWMRSKQGPRARVLVLGDARTAYLPAEALAASPFDEHPFKAWAAKAVSAQDLSAIVRRKGYDFVLFSRAEWSRVEDSARPFYASRGDTVTAQRVSTWLASLAADEKHRLELKQGAGWVFELH